LTSLVRDDQLFSYAAEKKNIPRKVLAEKCGLSEATLSRVMGRKRGKEVGSSDRSKFPASLLNAESNEQLRKLYDIIETTNPMAVDPYNGSRLRPPRLLSTVYASTQACLDRLARQYYGMGAEKLVEWEQIWADWTVRGPAGRLATPAAHAHTQSHTRAYSVTL